MQQIDNPSPLLFSQTGNGPCTPRKSFDLRPSPTNPLRITCTIRIFTSHESRLFRDYGSEENLNLGNDRRQTCGPVERKIAGFLQDYPVNGPRNRDPRFSFFAKKVYFFSFFSSNFGASELQYSLRVLHCTCIVVRKILFSLRYYMYLIFSSTYS